MSSGEILVARHGETQWNRERKWQGSSDIPLNEAGFAQARNLGESLRGEEIARIYSSDLQRAMSTAQVVSEVIGSGNISTDRRLRERGLGKFEGWKSVEVAGFLGIPEEQAEVLETDERSIEGAPGVEPWKSFVERVWAALSDISSSPVQEKTLVVAHGGVMRAVYYALTSQEKGMPEYRNGQFIRLNVDGKNWEIIR